MNNKNHKIDFSEGFKNEVTVISIAKEYPGFEGDEKYILITDTPEVVLRAAYPVEMELLAPYVICPTSMKDIMRMYEKNEKKHAWRAQRDAEMYTQELAEGKEYEEPSVEGFAEKADSEANKEEWDYLVKTAVKESFEILKDDQKRRLVMRVYGKLEYDVIADIEGVKKQSVHDCVKRAKAMFVKDFEKRMKTIRKNFA